MNDGEKIYGILMIKNVKGIIKNTKNNCLTDVFLELRQSKKNGITITMCVLVEIAKPKNKAAKRLFCLKRKYNEINNKEIGTASNCPQIKLI